MDIRGSRPSSEPGSRRSCSARIRDGEDGLPSGRGRMTVDAFFMVDALFRWIGQRETEACSPCARFQAQARRA
jgi:hypothetical protein